MVEYGLKVYIHIIKKERADKKMKISDVKIWKNEQGGNTKAYASITFEGAFVVTGLKVVEGKNGLFVSMPSRKVQKDGNDEYKDICFPITKEFREVIITAVLDKFNNEDSQDYGQSSNSYVPVQDDEIPF